MDWHNAWLSRVAAKQSWWPERTPTALGHRWPPQENLLVTEQVIILEPPWRGLNLAPALAGAAM
ncbi:hypothetical protein [Actinacidiphila soli]|uniref:hypothetical protein n=1 Tax=Actinacidiphila soli TaxID=2487275 RepID=UPI000FCB7135|nr:hypothetical protein [Actinacidiphila soli]